MPTTSTNCQALRSQCRHPNLPALPLESGVKPAQDPPANSRIEGNKGKSSFFQAPGPGMAGCTV